MTLTDDIAVLNQKVSDYHFIHDKLSGVGLGSNTVIAVKG